MPVNLFIILTIIIQTFFIILINHYIFILDDFNSLKRMLPLINLSILILFILLLNLIKKLEATAKRKIEMNLLKEHLNQIESMLKTMEQQKHDHTKHIQTLQAMVHLDEIEAAKKYIDGIAENYWYTEKIIDAGHPALTALLNSKRKAAELKRIIFDFSIKCDIGDIQLSSWDLCSIIGNLLDNAFEAVTDNKGRRNVGLEIKSENHNFAIYVTNNGTKLSKIEQENIFQLGYTTKDSGGRGYGLYLVKKLVEKYKGEIKVVSNDKTTFIVSFPKKHLKWLNRHENGLNRHNL